MGPRDTAATSLVMFAFTIGCVPSPSREGVGGYCHRDDHCIEGLRCVELACREMSRPEGPRMDGGTSAADAAIAIDAGRSGDAGTTDDAGPLDGGAADAGGTTDAGAAIDGG